MSEINGEVVKSNQYLTFVSAGSDYAIPIRRMREIVPYVGSTKVHLAPRVIRGLINLRGRAIPVLDLSIRFGRSETEVTNRTCVLIVDLNDDLDRPDLGILADSVSRVIDVEESALEETPDFGMGVSPEYMTGMLKLGEGFVPIIDVEAVISERDLQKALPGDGAGPNEDARREASAGEPVGERA